MSREESALVLPEESTVLGALSSPHPSSPVNQGAEEDYFSLQ